MNVWQVESMSSGGARIARIHDRWAAAGPDAAADPDTAARDDHEACRSGCLDELRDTLEKG